MSIPLSQQARIGAYVMRQHLARRKRYPLVLMLEPLFRCNLACAGCGKIDYPDEILNQRLSYQQCVRAQIDELAPRDDGRGDLRDFLVQKRLAAGDRHDRRAAFVDRLETFVDRESLIQDLVGIIDLAASRASEVAAEQRFQHQHERIAPPACKLLLDDVCADARFLQ